MKNFNCLQKKHNLIACLLSMVFILLMSSATIKETEPTDHFIITPKIYITSKGNSTQWAVAADSIKFSGKFYTPHGDLQNIKDFSFDLPITHVLMAANKTHPSILEAIKASNCQNISFTQKKLMILPTMKMVHMIGEVNLKRSQAVPLQLEYHLENDQQIHFKGKQIIALSEFGIKAEDVDAANRLDEITIHIEFTLTKTPKAGYPMIAMIDQEHQ